jgi:hypothetical protein
VQTLGFSPEREWELVVLSGVQRREDARNLTSLRARRLAAWRSRATPRRLAPQNFCGSKVREQLELCHGELL